MSSKILVVMSGGLDSTTLAYDMQARGWDISAVSFNYGQKHSKELEFAQYHAQANDWDHDVVDVSFLGMLLKSSLTGHGDVPEGHYAADNMKATIVPNRNAIMMSIACGIAVSRDVPLIGTAVHGGDHFIYPDCRPKFLNLLSSAFAEGNDPNFTSIIAPYSYKDKNYIAQRAVDLGYEWEKTWSCYKGGDKHCGKCGTCVERMEALWSTGICNDLDVGDITEQRLDILFPEDEYEDNTYWMKAVEESK